VTPRQPLEAAPVTASHYHFRGETTVKTSRKRIAVVVALVLLLAPGNAYSWSAGGHRIVAYIAYKQLPEATRAKLIGILKSHPEFKTRFRRPESVRAEDYDAWLFTQAAVWPDMIRDNEKYHHGTWHYINRPLFLSGADETALKNKLHVNLSGDLPAKAETADLNVVQAMKLCKQKLADKTVPDKDKAVYLCWMIHLVGDIHQPLHSTALFSKGRFRDGDRGGNRIRTKQNRNLHSFWDGLLGRELKHSEVVRRAASILSDADVRAAAGTAAKKLDFNVWVDESVKFARETVYSPPILAEVKAKESNLAANLKSIDLPVDYRKTAGKLARKRVAEGGFRLAAVLAEAAK
jgi:S1/P1 Nuclease